LRAHVELFKAEIGAILGLIGSMAAKGALALAFALLLGIMLYVGGLLFIGEWLFGSLGWGLAHGVLLPIGAIVALGLGIVGGTRGPALASLVVATLIAAALALLLGTNVLFQTSDYFARDVFGPPLDSSAIVGTMAGAVILGLLLAVLFSRFGGLGWIAFGLFLGALIGALLGFGATADEWRWPPALGLSISIGLIAWPILNLALTVPRLDLEAHFDRLAPRQTMAALGETRSWMEEQWRTRSPMRGRR
jgi:hypothetical protein